MSRANAWTVWGTLKWEVESEKEYHKLTKVEEHSPAWQMLLCVSLFEKKKKKGTKPLLGYIYFSVDNGLSQDGKPWGICPQNLKSSTREGIWAFITIPFFSCHLNNYQEIIEKSFQKGWEFDTKCRPKGGEIIE